jgi:hypothetical protein
MGLSSLAIIDSCIERVYAIRNEINSLYQRKHQLADSGRFVSSIQMTAATLRAGERAPVQLLDFRSGMPRFYNERIVNTPATAGPLPLGLTEVPYGMPAVTNADGSMAAPLTPGMNEAGQALDPGVMYLSKEQAQALYESYLRQINSIEAEITQKLEHLKAEMQALEKEQEQFQKYASSDIDKTFSNPYQGRG